MTSYLTFIETVHLYCSVFKLPFSVLTYPTCIWRPCWGDPILISQIFGSRKSVPGLSCGIAIVTLSLAISVEHRIVTA